jgi:hypothetical protein
MFNLFTIVRLPAFARDVIKHMPLQIAIRVRDGKKLTHEGIKVEFVGSIGMLSLPYAPTVGLTTDTETQNFSMTVDITTNFSRYRKN